MGESKVKRILGLSSTISLVQDDPYAAVNRRISLVVLNARTERRMDLESSTEELQVDAQGNVQSMVEKAVEVVPAPGAGSAQGQASGSVVQEAPPNQ